MIVAQSQAQLNQSNAQLNQLRGGLIQAQTYDMATQNQIDQMKAQTENTRSQAEIMQSHVQSQSDQADIEAKRATAILNLTKAGQLQAGAQTDQLKTALDFLNNLLDTGAKVHIAHHNTQAAAQQAEQVPQTVQ